MNLRLLRLAALSIISIVTSQTSALAQRYDVSTVTGVTFTPLTTPTQVNEIKSDDALSLPINIGFNFQYFGTTYTKLKASSNGFITFDIAAVSAAPQNRIDKSPVLNLIAAFWDDLEASTTGVASYAVTGSAPNRIFTFEWLNWNWNKGDPIPSISFQVKLYETSNNITFHYKLGPGYPHGDASTSIGLVSDVETEFYSYDNFATFKLSPTGNNALYSYPADEMMFTLNSTPITRPTKALTNLKLNLTSDTTGYVTWNLEGASGSYYVMFMKETSSLTDVPVLTDGVFYRPDSLYGHSDQTAGPGWYCIGNGPTSGDLQIANFNKNTSYKIVAISYNGLGDQQKYFQTTEDYKNPYYTTANEYAYGMPRITNLSDKEVTFGFQSSDVVNTKLIFIKKSVGGSTAINNSDSFQGNTIFGKGTQIGNSGWYCVYNGPVVKNVVVTGLEADQDYTFHVRERTTDLNPVYTDVKDVPAPRPFRTQPAIVQSNTYAVTAASVVYQPLVNPTFVPSFGNNDHLYSSDSIQLDFPITLFGVPHLTCYITQFGYISFNHLLMNTTRPWLYKATNTTCFGCFNIQNDLDNNFARPLIAPFWDASQLAYQGKLSYATVGSAPNRIFTVEWTNLTQTYNPIGKVEYSMQLKAYENDGTIQFIYNSPTPGNAGVRGAVGLAFDEYGEGNFLSIQNFNSVPDFSPVTAKNDLTLPPNGYSITFTPKKFDQSIQFTSVPDISIDKTSLVLAAQSTSGLPVQLTTTSPGISLTGNTVFLNVPGRVSIVASQNGDARYAAATPTSQSFCVNPSKPIVDIDTLGNKTYKLTSSSPDGNEWFRNNISVSTSSSVTTSTPGTYFVKTTVNECTSDPSNQIILKKIDQLIAFASIPDKKMGDATFDLVASSDAGLPIQFSTTTSSKISVSNNVVSILAAGKASVVASQPGNEIFAAATPVTNAFCINPSKPSIHQSITTSGAIVLSSSSAEGNRWFFGNALVDSASTYVARSPGKYSVRVTTEGCTSERSDEIDIVIAGIDEFNDESIQVYPNPAKAFVYVEISSSRGSEATISVYDYNGRALDTFHTEKQIFTITFENRNAGVYVITIAKDGKVVRKRVAKI